MTIYEQVQQYYGSVLGGSEDLRTDACSTQAEPPAHIKAALAQIHPEVHRRYYGCGLVCPAVLEGMRVLDLGCGTGRDCFLLSQLVGAEGEVVGVDMTGEQLALAREMIDYHTDKFGYDRPNVRFEQGYIEELEALGLEAGSFDLIVSNCVVNLAPDKATVLAEARRLLRPGGEMYFADVYADRRLPEACRMDPELYGECLGGALYWNDFQNLAKQAGFADPRLVEDRPIAVDDAALAERLGNARFFSATYRLFNLAGLEPACEDYGQAAIYNGGIAEHPHAYRLDKHHLFEAGRTVPVCGNTYRMLAESRLGSYFELIGDFSTHYGIFEGCGVALPFDAGEPAASACC